MQGLFEMGPSFSIMGALGILAVILAIVATVLAFIFIVPEKKRSKLNGFGKFLHDTLNFKYLIVEKILQAFYIFTTALVILEGIFLLFVVTPYGGWQGGKGILTIIVGPIAIRLVYELILMLIILVKNVTSINKKLKNQNDEDSNNDVFAAPSFQIKKDAAPAETPVAPVAPATPAAKFCVKCGSALDAEGKCPNCDK